MIYDKNGNIRKEVLCERACSVCGSGEHKFLFTKDKSKFVKCKKCNFVYVNPSLKPNVLKKYYEESEEEYWTAQITDEWRNLLKKKFDNELEFIEKYSKKGKVLDIGCGAGIFLYHAKSRGWDVYGTEFNKFSRNFIKNKMYISNIFPGEMEQFKNNYFDLVTLHQCFEHLPDPNKMLDDANRILKTKGLLFISVPHINGISTKIMGKESVHYGKEHLNYFNRKNLKIIIEKHGFEVLSFKTEGVKIESIIPFLRSKFKEKNEKDEIVLNNKIASKVKVGNIYFKIYYFICSILNLFLFGDYLIVLARKRK